MFSRNAAMVVALLLVFGAIVLQSLLFQRLLSNPEHLLVTLPISGALGWFIPNIAKKLEKKADAHT